MSAQIAEHQGTTRLIETARPLSRSLLWGLQRRFYEQAGAAAWGNGPVPYYITSTPLLARAYAKLVLGFLRDCAAQDLLDRTSPVYLLELGAGSGRFSFHFRRRLDELLARSPFRDLQVTLVMSDFAAATVEHWRQRAEFAPWVAEGRIDFAHFDLERDQELCLMASGVVLRPGIVGNPIVCIANYVVDRVPQDAFRIEHGEMVELLAELSVAEGPGEATLDDLRLCFHPRAIGADHYGRMDFDCLLQEYRACREGTQVLLPVAALDCVTRLRALGGGRMLLVAGDKGYGAVADFPVDAGPVLAGHGSRSMMVNFDAIGRVARAAGGVAWCPSARALGLHVGAFLFGISPGDAAECDLAYWEAIDSGGPDDFFAVQMAVERPCCDWELDQIIAYLRLAGWDSHIFHCCLPAIRAGLAVVRPKQRDALLAAIAAVDAAYLPTGEPYNLAFDLGLLLLELDQFAAAAAQFAKSLLRHGPDCATLLERGISLFRMGNLEEAMQQVDLVLALDPTNPVAQQLQSLILRSILSLTE